MRELRIGARRLKTLWIGGWRERHLRSAPTHTELSHQRGKALADGSGCRAPDVRKAWNAHRMANASL